MYVSEKEKKTVAKSILWLRKQHGLSQKEMAKMLSIAPTSLSKTEKENYPQGFAFWFRFAFLVGSEFLRKHSFRQLLKKQSKSNNSPKRKKHGFSRVFLYL